MKPKPTHLLTLSFFVLCIFNLRAQAPVITSFNPQKGRAGTLVTIQGTNLSIVPAVSIGGVNAIVLSASDNKVVAFVMPGTQTGKVAVTTANGVGISTSNFFLSTPNLPVKNQSKIVSPNTGENTYFGSTVALSADGNTTVIGCSSDEDTGSIWIYVRNTSGQWAQQGNKLRGSGIGYYAWFGASVAISADGNTIVAGGTGYNNDGGAIWVFVRNGGVWSQQGPALVVDSIAPEANFGASVSISADGNTIVAGSCYDGEYQIGSAWVFKRNGTTWNKPVKKLAPSDATRYAYFGAAVSISADAKTIAIGGYNDDANSGANWIFIQQSNNEWVQQGNKLIGNIQIRHGASQGCSIAINADGTTFITGGYDDNFSKGSAWVFTLQGDKWVQQGSPLVPSDGEQPVDFGSSVSISADGNRALISGPGDKIFHGAAWIFEREDGKWVQQGNKIVPSDVIGDKWIGVAQYVSLSADGSTAILSGDGDNNFLGAAWVYSDTASVLPVTFTGFKAYQLGKGNQLEWQGYGEVNMQKYDVERSADGRQFIKLGSLPVKGNTNINSYTWFDAQPVTGDNYYRIKALSKNATVQYSATIKLAAGIDANTGVFVYPNPVYDKAIHLKLNNLQAGSYNISVYNVAGQKVAQRTYTHNGSSAAIVLPANDMAPGMYKVIIKNNQASYQTSVLVR